MGCVWVVGLQRKTVNIFPISYSGKFFGMLGVKQCRLVKPKLTVEVGVFCLSMRNDDFIAAMNKLYCYCRSIKFSFFLFFQRVIVWTNRKESVSG